jgi:hypothetical protein
MEYALVFLSALLVGAIVYWVTLRQEQRPPAEEVDYTVPAEGAPPPPPSSSGTLYVPLIPAAATTWETRVSGVVGIVVIVALSAAVLALALYLGGAFIVGLFGDAATNGGVTGP